MAATDGKAGRNLGLLAAGIGALAGSTARADTTVDFRFLHYKEGDGRTQVSNPEIYMLQDFGEKGQFGLLLSYDSISGASPTGEMPTMDATASASSSSSSSIPKAQYTDTRQAITGSYSKRFGSQLPSITLSYSHESDYLSRGVSLVDSLDLFGGRSTLHGGIGITRDQIDPVGTNDSFTKSSDSYSIGWTQILGPRDLVDFSFGLDKLNGYLTDPYKRVTLDPNTSVPEVRPDTRSRKSAVIKFGHYFTTRGALKTSYRYYWDDWSIRAHTIDLTFDQRVGDKVIVTPRLRYYRQSAAEFFGYEFSTPQPYMSGDYRLSSFWSWLAGIGLTVEVSDRVSVMFEATYADQTGLDRVRPLGTPTLLLKPPVTSLENENENEGGGSSSVSPADLQTLTATVGLRFKF